MFIGIFQLGTGDSPFMRTPNACLDNALDPYGVADRVGRLEFHQAKLHQALVFNTPESKLESVPTVCEHTGCAIVAWVRLDNRQELGSKLAIKMPQLGQTTDPQLILAAYRKWGTRCVEQLLGDFSFCIYDPVHQSIFAARDPLGVKPLFYHQTNEAIVLSSGARMFWAIDGLLLTPKEEWIAQYSIGLSMSFTDTCWPDVFKLAPGHVLLMEAGKPMRISAYFSWSDDAPESTVRQDHYVEAYREVLEESVRCRLRTEYPLGCETSGGIDSSTIIGIAATQWDSDEDLHTFGHAYCADEPKYILETSQWHQIAQNHISTGYRFRSIRRDLLDRTLNILGYPEEHSVGSSYDFFYKDCQKYKVRTLLSGFGGDEIVTNTGQLLFHELADKRLYFQYWKNLPGSYLGRTARFAKRLLSDGNSSTAKQLVASYQGRWSAYSLREDVEKRYDLRALSQYSAQFDNGYRRINDFILGGGIAPYMATRFENCTLMAAARGVEYRWPLVDARLVQQYLSTPSIEKFGAGYGRYLHRRAIEGVVPPMVQWKGSKYMGETGSGRDANVSHLAGVKSELDGNIHPALEPVIDLARVKKQLDYFETMHRNREPHRWFGALKHYRALVILNRWLHVNYG